MPLLTKRHSSEKARDIMRTPDMFLSKQEREEKKRRLNEAQLFPKPEPLPESKPDPPVRSLNTPAMFKKPSQRWLFFFIFWLIRSDQIKSSSSSSSFVPKQQWRGLDFPIHPPVLLYPSEPVFPSSPPVAPPQISFAGSYFSGVSPIPSDATVLPAPSEPSESIESVINELSVRVMRWDEW